MRVLCGTGEGFAGGLSCVAGTHHPHTDACPTLQVPLAPGASSTGVTGAAALRTTAQTALHGAYVVQR